MSDEHGYSSPGRRVEFLIQGFSHLSPADQDLVMALVTRLQDPGGVPEFPPDVRFMDFEE